MTEARQIPAGTQRIRRFFRISLVVGFLLLINYGGSLVVKQIDFQLWPMHEHLLVTMVWLSIVVYVLWMAIPFVPGVELAWC